MTISRNTAHSTDRRDTPWDIAPADSESESSNSESSSNCHFSGPTGSCPCSKNDSFVLRSPSSTFRQQKYLLILDIDETILSSVQPMLSHSMWFGYDSNDNNSEHRLSRSASNIEGVWQYGFELFFLSELDAASIIRPGFFKTLDFVLQNGFNVIVYTRSDPLFPC